MFTIRENGKRREFELVKQMSDWNGDGRIYPTTVVIVKSELDVLPYLVYDTTGWDGHEQCEDVLVAMFANEEDAIDYVTWMLTNQ